ncbi:hypothetical protein B0T10DRAFT_565294 [Thelonectria olida]|uniref:NB-ARC domain-containing protein n=1 Tax=Thelonectria olida TaxID=1576542 RepID=A0A9P9ALK4_9HYPO|nr:hypothetical protein B0T10DRAFT_565294 [Thelonectria olida]
MTFNYDSKWFMNAPQQRLSNISDKLLVSLRHKREKQATGRPLIFIGHSFGGNLVEQFNFASHAPPRSIRPFSTVPFPPDPMFVERTDILLWLREQTARPGSRAALVGLGGIGKSQVAIHYAHEVRQASPDTWVF